MTHLRSFTTAALELSLPGSPRGLAIFLAVLGATIVLLAKTRARMLTGPPGLRFEEEDPDALVDGFRLSEGLAARAPGPRSSI